MLPSGTVTFLFTDIDGSTRLWEQSAAQMKIALARHDALMRLAIARNGGYVFTTAGDAFCSAFHTAPDALAAALDAQLALATEPWPEAAQIKVRMALHTGAAEVRDNDYFGQPLIRVACLLAAGHGGQVLLSMTAQELVKEIDTYFSAFDRIMQQYGLEKIKTIGDAYIAAGGLPEGNSATTEKVVEAAIAMQNAVEDLKKERIENDLPYFELRIGIHTGPVVAGVVGIKKFQYDIWGDTVNLAARMEQSGVPGKINISQNTYEIIKEKFKCEHRGKIEAKNKGEINMYFVGIKY